MTVLITPKIEREEKINSTIAVVFGYLSGYCLLGYSTSIDTPILSI